MVKKSSKNLQTPDPKELIEQLTWIREKYKGREPTPEEWSAEIKAFAKGLPRPSKDVVKTRQLEKLQGYIDLANRIPPYFYSMDIRRAVLDDPQSPREGSIEYDLKRFRFLLLYLEESKPPSDFREYILEEVTDDVMSYVRSPGSVPDDEVWKPLSGVLTALQRYDEFHDTREKLRKIANIKRPRLFFLHNYVPTYSYLYADSDGILQLHLDDFAETLKGLEADRVRECPICKRIFWANPKSKMSCSPRCRNLFNVRKHRDLMKKNKAHK